MTRVCSICRGLDQYGERSPNRVIKPGSTSEFCSVCRSSMNGWSRRPVAELLNYRTQLRVRGTRMEHVADMTPRKPKRSKR